MSTALAESNPQNQNAQSLAISSRASQEVQAAMVVAKKFPRDTNQAMARILHACKRPTLADKATYEYPRGGETVTGPSIRLAEAMAQSWGNLDFGIVELGQENGESQVMAYCWDLETNTRQTKIFTVPHIRHTRKGAYKLDDPRDVYELVANQGARRLRACILGVIPGDVVEEALIECDKTLTNASSKIPLAERIQKAVAAISAYRVTVKMLEVKMGHPLAEFTERDVLMIGRLFNSLRDGMVKPEDVFEELKPQTAPSDTKDVFAGAQTEKKESAPEQEQPAEKPAAKKAAPKQQPAKSQDDDLLGSGN
jgi:hypothetical protein